MCREATSSQVQVHQVGPRVLFELGIKDGSDLRASI